MSGSVALEDHPCLRQIQLYTASVKSVHATPARDPIGAPADQVFSFASCSCESGSLSRRGVSCGCARVSPRGSRGGQRPETQTAGNPDTGKPRRNPDGETRTPIGETRTPMGKPFGPIFRIVCIGLLYIWDKKLSSPRSNFSSN